MLPPQLRKPLAALALSVAGATALINSEGIRLEAYRPFPTDVPTIAAGSTLHPDGSAVRLGDKITRKQVIDYVQYDADRHKQGMLRCVKVPLSQNEFDAFLNFTINVGTSNFCNSTLVKKLNAYDYEGACKEMLRWDRFQGKPTRGLQLRRQREVQMCLTKDNPEVQLASK